MRYFSRMLAMLGSLQNFDKPMSYNQCYFLSMEIRIYSVLYYGVPEITASSASEKSRDNLGLLVEFWSYYFFYSDNLTENFRVSILFAFKHCGSFVICWDVKRKVAALKSSSLMSRPLIYNYFERIRTNTANVYLTIVRGTRNLSRTIE